MSFSTLVEKLYWEELAKENITKGLLDMVDLDIAFSPVIPFKNDSPCDVIKTIGGNYLVQHAMFPNAVTSDELKVMRYRYLTNR